MAPRLSATALATFVAVATGTSDANMYKLSLEGACRVQGGLDGFTFTRKGYTKTGAPYFEAANSELYMYYEPDCLGSTGSTPRWVIDRIRPDVTKNSDLDGDHACNYIARVESNDLRVPPTQAEWTIVCDGVEKNMFVTLRAGTSSPMPPAIVLPTAGARSMVWDGACAWKAYVNGAVFDEVGATADGRPFYKARDRDQYIYFDADCDGLGSGRPARWVLDNSRPSTTATRDLDSDSACDYHARFDSTSITPPPSGTWRMYCGEAAGGWVDVRVALRAPVVAVNSAHGHSAFVAVALLLAYALDFVA